jgi:hypothetical protein
LIVVAWWPWSRNPVVRRSELAGGLSWLASKPGYRTVTVTPGEVVAPPLSSVTVTVTV